jgi:hypothetical protein
MATFTEQELKQIGIMIAAGNPQRAAEEYVLRRRSERAEEVREKEAAEKGSRAGGKWSTYVRNSPEQNQNLLLNLLGLGEDAPEAREAPPQEAPPREELVPQRTDFDRLIEADSPAPREEAEMFEQDMELGGDWTDEERAEIEGMADEIEIDSASLEFSPRESRPEVLEAGLGSAAKKVINPIIDAAADTIGRGPKSKKAVQELLNLPVEVGGATKVKVKDLNLQTLRKFAADAGVPKAWNKGKAELIDIISENEAVRSSLFRRFSKRTRDAASSAATAAKKPFTKGPRAHEELLNSVIVLENGAKVKVKDLGLVPLRKFAHEAGIKGAHNMSVKRLHEVLRESTLMRNSVMRRAAKRTGDAAKATGEHVARNPKKYSAAAGVGVGGLATYMATGGGGGADPDVDVDPDADPVSSEHTDMHGFPSWEEYREANVGKGREPRNADGQVIHVDHHGRTQKEMYKRHRERQGREMLAQNIHNTHGVPRHIARQAAQYMAPEFDSYMPGIDVETAVDIASGRITKAEAREKIRLSGRYVEVTREAVADTHRGSVGMGDPWHSGSLESDPRVINDPVAFEKSADFRHKRKEWMRLVKDKYGSYDKYLSHKKRTARMATPEWQARDKARKKKRRVNELLRSGNRVAANAVMLDIEDPSDPRNMVNFMSPRQFAEYKKNWDANNEKKNKKPDSFANARRMAAKVPELAITAETPEEKEKIRKLVSWINETYAQNDEPSPFGDVDVPGVGSMGSTIDDILGSSGPDRKSFKPEDGAGIAKHGEPDDPFTYDPYFEDVDPTPVNLARYLHKAMKGGLMGAGTDEDAMATAMHVLNQLPPSVAREVIEKYRELYDRDLKEDVTDELGGVPVFSYERDEDLRDRFLGTLNR